MPERLVKSAYRQLWRLIKQQPPAQAAAGLKELRETTRSHAGEVNPEQILAHYKELVSRISFLRITTPRAPGTPLQGGRFVLRDGELVEGSGEDKGARGGAPTAVSEAEGRRLNAEHYKRFYGKTLPKKMLF